MGFVGFLYAVISGVLSLLVWMVIINAVISWLVAFQVINLRNPTAYNAVRGLDRAVQPLLWPLRRIIPPLGGLDITPVVFIIIVQAAQQYLLPSLFRTLALLLGGQALI